MTRRSRRLDANLVFLPRSPVPGPDSRRFKSAHRSGLSMSTFLQLTFSGLALGAIYALVALGFVVIYRASQVFNFAHGDLLMLGAYLMVAVCAAGLPWPLALAVTLVGTGLVAAAIERGLLRPLVGRPVFVTIIVTIFIGLLLRIAIQIIWGPDVRGMPTPWPVDGRVHIGGAAVLYNAFATLILGGLALGAFFLLLRYSKIGVAMRAVSQDQEAALSLGLPVGRILGLTWAIAGAFAALAGICLAMFPRSVEINLAFIALAAFPAVLVGGLESMAGAVIAGLLLGVLQVWAQAYLNPVLGGFGHNFHTVFPFVVMIAFLMFRPEGLFGQHRIKRV
jgi:branched-chain amino acid transport system permease protein